MGQTNLTEIDPEICDIGWWKEFWKKTDTQGIIVNAGGIVEYYPTQLKLQYKAEKLGDRDLFGEFVKAGRDMGIPFIPKNANDIDIDAKNLDLLILPELAVMSDSQCDAVNRFAALGKNVMITGNTCIETTR